MRDPVERRLHESATRAHADVSESPAMRWAPERSRPAAPSKAALSRNGQSKKAGRVGIPTQPVSRFAPLKAWAIPHDSRLKVHSF